MALTLNIHARPAVALAVLACAVVLAACGSSSRPNAAAQNDHAAGIKFASCMRAHGLSNFPDPEDPADVQIPINFASHPSPAFTSAQKACQYLVPPGSPPVVSASQQAQALKFAQCVREHGVPNYPDPIYKDRHQVLPPPPLSLSQFTQLIVSPAYHSASKACESP